MPLSPNASPVTRALREFLRTEVAGGAVLIAGALVALVWANSPWREAYEHLWHTGLGVSLGRYGFDLDLRHWVNEGLMALFFLVVGLEVKRELLLGELRDRRAATLPVVAAIGGMVMPAIVFLVVRSVGGGVGGADGWGVPVATDIAFALGVLALVAPSAPSGVRLFLLTLAIVDDIGAIVIIAIFYSDELRLSWLLIAVGLCVAVVVLRRLGLRTPPLFATIGVVIWFAVHESGLHATLAGVVMGLLAPASPALDHEIIRSRGDDLLDVFSPRTAKETTQLARQAVSELEYLEHRLHGFSSFVIVPLFALANAGVELSASGLRAAATSPIALGVLAGLVVGKFAGIAGAAWLAVKLRIASLPDDMSWSHLRGAAALGGIGFTVSIFISGLAFSDNAVVAEAKIAIIAASLVAGLFAAMLFRRTARP